MQRFASCGVGQTTQNLTVSSYYPIQGRLNLSHDPFFAHQIFSSSVFILEPSSTNYICARLFSSCGEPTTATPFPQSGTLSDTHLVEVSAAATATRLQLHPFLYTVHIFSLVSTCHRQIFRHESTSLGIDTRSNPSDFLSFKELLENAVCQATLGNYASVTAKPGHPASDIQRQTVQ